MIGVGGSFRNIFKISKMVRKYPLDTVHNYVLPTEDFESIYDMIKVLDLDKKKKIKGISSGRADILPAALAVVKSFTRYMKFESFTIGGSGLREGIMFNQAMPVTLEKPHFRHPGVQPEHAGQVLRVQRAARRARRQSLRPAVQAAARAA